MWNNATFEETSEQIRPARESTFEVSSNVEKSHI
jgi:hypothetical protein